MCLCQPCCVGCQRRCSLGIIVRFLWPLLYSIIVLARRLQSSLYSVGAPVLRLAAVLADGSRICWASFVTTVRKVLSGVTVVLIRNSDLNACTTAIPTSPDHDLIQSPFSITIEFETDTTKSGGWTLVAQRACPRARQHKRCLAPAPLATSSQPNRIAKLII